jgi:hypothetical protein
VTRYIYWRKWKIFRDKLKKHVRDTGYKWHKSNYARHMLQAGQNYGSVEENMKENLGKRPTAGSMRKVHIYLHNKEHNVLNAQNISRPSSCLTSSQKSQKRMNEHEYTDTSP